MKNNQFWLKLSSWFSFKKAVSRTDELILFPSFSYILPSLKLTVRPDKWMVGILFSYWGGLFSGVTVSFREGSPCGFCAKSDVFGKQIRVEQDSTPWRELFEVVELSLTFIALGIRCVSGLFYLDWQTLRDLAVTMGTHVDPLCLGAMTHILGGVKPSYCSWFWGPRVVYSFSTTCNWSKLQDCLCCFS